EGAGFPYADVGRVGGQVPGLERDLRRERAHRRAVEEGHPHRAARFAVRTLEHRVADPGPQRLRGVEGSDEEALVVPASARDMREARLGAELAHRAREATRGRLIEPAGARRAS